MALRNDEIIQQYRTPGHPSAFSAPGNVARVQPGVGRKLATSALQEIDSYVLHKESKRPKTFNPYFVYKRRQLVQADLIDIRALSRSNSGVNYLLLAIDLFSRKIHVYPLKTKSANDMRAALGQYLNDLGRPTIKVFMTDAGLEFWNRPVKQLLRSKNIELRLAAGTSKACYAERANKTMQILIYKYLSDRETTKYIDVLQDLVSTYNKRGHRSLNFMSPNEADKPRNALAVRAIAVQRFSHVKRKKPTMKVGDVVRIKTLAAAPNPARRAYAKQYHGEYFTITRINLTLPIPLYYLKSMNSEEDIRGGFYSNELSKVSGNVFKIEKILRRRVRRGQNQIFVKWKHFDDRWNEWIPEANIVERFRQ